MFAMTGYSVIFLFILFTGKYTVFFIYLRNSFETYLELPILPISLIGTEKILPVDSLNIFPGCVKMTVHKPIDISAYKEENSQELMKLERKVIEEGLKNSDNRAS